MFKNSLKDLSLSVEKGNTTTSITNNIKRQATLRHAAAADLSMTSL